MVPLFLKFSCKHIQSFISQTSSKYSMNVSVKIQCEGLTLRSVNFLLVHYLDVTVILPLLFAKQQEKHQILEQGALHQQALSL